jgi:hypothetical protein
MNKTRTRITTAYTRLTFTVNRLNRGGKRQREPEFILQTQIVDALKKILDYSVCFTAFPAGGGGRIRGAKLKKAGLTPGWPDIQLIAKDGRYYGMEVKTATGRLSQAQRSLHKRLEDNGCKVVVVRSVEEAMDAVHDWRITKSRYRGRTKTMEGSGTSSTA